jgi:hypothetical protein
MAQTSWPFQAVDTTETQFSQWARHIIRGGRSGVNGVPTGTELLVTANSSGMQVSVAAGQALVRGHYYASTAAETLAIGASGANPRIDSIVLKLDPSLNTVVLEVVAGTAGTSPVPPTLTHTDSAIFQFKLADVRVDSGVTTIDAGKVTDGRQFMMDIWTTANRPTPIVGLVGFNTTTGRLELYNGTSWADVSGTLDASVITSGTFNVDRIPSLDAAKITSGTVSADRLGTVTVAKGGTGATDAAAARTNLGVAATAHTHAIADVTSLQTSLDGKAASSHTHTASAITDPQNLSITKLDGRKLTVSATAPTSPAVGDLWDDVS